MGTLSQDVRDALRWLVRNPGFAAVAILTLALGIGTVTTIFSILDAAVLRPLPYPNSDALMTVAITHREGNVAPETFVWSSPKFDSLRRHASSFERVAAHSSVDLNLTGVGEPERLAAEIVSPAYFSVLGVDAADYFRTLSIPFRKGRAFTAADREGSPKVAIVSQSTARKLWPGQDPIGRRVAATSFFFADNATAEVVGVAGDVLYGKPGEPQILDLYFPTLQGGIRWATLFIRTPGNPAAIAPAVRREIKALAPDLPVFDVATMTQRSARTFSRDRFGATLLGLLAVIALFLASVGISGLVAETVSAQTREIGVRMALGARPGDILRGVLQRGLVLAGIGLAVGLVAALALSRLLSSLLFEVRPTDPGTYAGVSALLLLLAAVASWLPARRATRIDPTLALRHE